MKLTAQQVFDATITLATIIREKRPMPLKGSYRISRLHSKLLTEFAPISERRDELIKAYDFHPLIQKSAGPNGEIELASDPDRFEVPPDKIVEFNAAWSEIASEVIEVDVQPVPLCQLDLGNSVAGSVFASELQILGNLVNDDA